MCHVTEYVLILSYEHIVAEFGYKTWPPMISLGTSSSSKETRNDSTIHTANDAVHNLVQSKSFLPESILTSFL